MIKTEKQNIEPMCPHCEKKVKKLIVVKSGWFLANNVFCCPHCKKIVGMTAGAR